MADSVMRPRREVAFVPLLKSVAGWSVTALALLLATAPSVGIETNLATELAACLLGAAAGAFAARRA